MPLSAPVPGAASAGFFYARYLICLSFASDLALPLQAQTNFTWVGGGGSWTTPAKWNPEGVPNEMDTAIIPAGNVTLNTDLAVAGLQLSGGSLSGGGSQSITVRQSGQWSGGTISSLRLVVAAECTFTLDGAATKTLGSQGVITNAGKMVWSGGQFNLDNGQDFLNLPGAVFEVQTDARLLQNVAGTSSFRNDGTYLKSAGTGTNSINIGAFINRGTVLAASGAIRFQASGLTSTGPGNALLADAGGALQLQSGGGESRFSDTTFGGLGAKILNPGAANAVVTGSIAATNLVFAGGQWHGESVIAGDLDWTGGTVYNAQITISAGSRLLVSGAGAKMFTGGGTGVITNLGTVIWTGGTLSLENNARLVNQADAVFDVQTDAAMVQAGGGASTFQNEGTYLKSAGLGTHTFALAAFINRGRVWAKSGTLQFTPRTLTATSPGNSFDAEEGAFLQLSPAGGQTAFTDTAFGGAGLKTLNLGSGSANVNGRIAATNLVFAGGNWEGQSILTGDLNWTGGTIYNAQLTVDVGSRLVLSGAGPKLLTGGGSGAITNLGTVTWTGGAFNLENSARFVNQAGAVFDVKTDAPLAQNGGGFSTFHNEGTYQKSAGTGTNTISLGAFVQSGTLAIETGVVKVVGDYVQSPDAVLRINVDRQDSEITFGQLQVTGKATLDGKLAIATLGDAGLASGDAIPFLTAGSRSGFFATVTGGPIGNETYLTPVYGNQGVGLLAAGPAAVFTAPIRQANGIQFQVRGVAGQTYRVEASTNLIDWVTVSTLPVSGSGAAAFIDEDSSKYDARFYRTIFSP